MQMVALTTTMTMYLVSHFVGAPFSNDEDKPPTSNHRRPVLAFHL
jgi:hypothetical protein